MEQHGTTMSSSYNFIIQIPRDSFFSIFLGSPVLLWAPQQSFVPVKPYSSSHSSRYRQISMPRPKENAPAPVQFLWRPIFSCLLYVPQNNQQTWRYDWYSFYRFQFRHPKNGRIFSPEFATRSVLCFSPGSTCRSSSWGAGSFVPAQVEPQSSSGRWGSSLRRSRAMRPCCVERSCFWWWNGYGSIPINTYFYTIFSGLFTSINPSYFDVNRRGTIGFDTSPFLGLSENPASDPLDSIGRLPLSRWKNGWLLPHFQTLSL